MDARALAELHAACFDEAPRPWSAQEFADASVSPRQAILQADSGFAVVQVVADQAELLTIAVAPAARRLGIGAQLMAQVMELARARGAVELFLEVDATNRAARALYEQCGFTLSGQRKGYYRRADGTATDALVMVCSLVTPRQG